MTNSAIKNQAKTHKHNVPTEVTVTRKQKKKANYYFLYVAIILFILYSVFTLSNINMQKTQKQQQLFDLNKKIDDQTAKNQELETIYNYEEEEFEKYKERIIKDSYGYVSKGERVFINIMGD